MAFSLKPYADSGLTAQASNITAAQASDGSSAAVDRVVYIGSTVAGKKFQAFSNPGVDNIVVSLVDANSGGGVQAAHAKLATTQAGLASAVAGAALSLGTQILSGAANARAVWLRIDTPALAEGAYTDLSLALNDLVETAV